MKLTTVVAALALTLGVAACKKKNETKTDDKAMSGDTTASKTTDKAPAAKGRKIPNGNGLVVEAPAKWIDNGIGGAAGMHLDADGGMFMVRETAPEEAAKKMADWKKETEEMMFQKWVSADETPDGWKALYVVDKITMKGDEAVKDGSNYAFHVRRKIGDKVHDCYGSAAKQEDAQEGLDICTKIAAN